MMISLIICTYKRAVSLKKLLDNIVLLHVKPYEILIIDGSPDFDTKEMIANGAYLLPVKYWQVPPEERGLTKQRNYGIKRVATECDIICFLDDDVLLDDNYFQVLEDTFVNYNDCIGVMGIITNENKYVKCDAQKHVGKRWFLFDGYALRLSERFYMRRLLGLFPEMQPGRIPGFGHGYHALPPSGKIYEVDHIIGASTYRKWIFEKVKFSEYFEGYGLYEDFDFSVRASALGRLLVNTNLKFEHHHHPSGRPNMYYYGKMVTRNGWYVWRLKNRQPSFMNRIKWTTISFLLAVLLLKSVTKKKAWLQFSGRVVGLFSLIFTPPKIAY